MPIRRIREEVEVLHHHLSSERVDIAFVMSHLNSLWEVAQVIRKGEVFESTEEIDKHLIREYHRQIKSA